jgi:SIR2-like domain
MSDLSLDDALLTLAFSIKSNPGAYALLIGAGVSAGSGVKTAWGVLEDLVGRVAQLAGTDDVTEPIGWYERTYGEEPRYETLLEKLAPTQLERQRLLRDYFEPTAEEMESGQKTPTPAHHAIARMVRSGSIRVIVTLNFDRLIEQSLRAVGIEPTVIASPADVDGMAPLHTIDCCVIHLHGDYLNATSMRNTTIELEVYHPNIVRLLNEVLRDYGLIIAGWSSKYDPMLREAIASQYSPRMTLAWIEPGPVSDTAAQLRTLKKGLLLPSDANSAFGRLSDAIAALQGRNAAHPLTVAVAVGTAKRELSGRPIAIGLHDTLNHEFTRLHDHPDFHPPSYQDDAAYGGYVAILDRVEEASRLACALVATLAYWGNTDTDRWWIEELHRFTLRPRADGLTRLIGLKSVTGSALFYSAGIAAVASQRFDLLARLLSTSGPDPYSANRLLDAATLDPARVYEVRNGAGRSYALIAPLLREALAVNDEALDDAWQRFEVLRLAAITMRGREFTERFGKFLTADDALALAQQSFETAERERRGVDEARVARADGVQKRGRRLGQLADLVPLAASHLLAADAHFDLGHRIPIADRLAEDVSTEADRHPLIASGVADNPSTLSAALLAVSVAGGRRGHKLAWRPLGGQGGIIVDEIWLDSGKTPSEVRQAATS